MPFGGFHQQIIISEHWTLVHELQAQKSIADVDTAGETIGAEYKLEYGTDRIEMTVESISKGQNVLIIDDLIATGGTLGAAVQLVEKVGAKVHEAACVIELPELQGRAKLKATNVPLFVLLEKEA